VVPQVWNIPARNPGFTGRDGLLIALRERLLSGDRAMVQTLRGMGGVGKTQLAAEYAHQFASSYELAWWVHAEQPALIAEGFAALGAALGCTATGAEVGGVRSSVLGELRRRGRWLLVFDNAESAASLRDWLPGGNGHVLITTRERGWADIAETIEIDVLHRLESVTYLRHRVSGLRDGDAGLLAAQLGDLPLGLAQAAGYITQTGISVPDYLRLLGTMASRLLDQATPVDYPRSLAAATQLTAGRLAHDDPAAAELAGLCAFLGPDPIPPELFTAAVTELPAALAAQVADPIGWPATRALLADRALVRIDERGLTMHRLIQGILRDRLGPDEARRTRAGAEAALAANGPGDPGNPATWPRWAQLMPHLLAADLAATANPDLRAVACDLGWYLLERGDTSSALDLVRRLHDQWRTRLGEDDPHTLRVATQLAWALCARGDYTAARALDEDTLARRRRLLGEDHPETLTTASNLVATLGELGETQAARELAEDIYQRRRRVLGDTDPLTLLAASNLADARRDDGDYATARELGEETLAHCRSLLGDRHPSTLISLSNVAVTQRKQGEVKAAKMRGEDALAGLRATLGEDHPYTLAAATELAATLRALEMYAAARDLDEDTLKRRNRVLGEGHPSTLSSSYNLDEDEDLLRLGRAGDSA
jgi:hypothetical protein